MVIFVGSAIPGDRDGFKMSIEFFLFNFKRSACRIVKLKDKEEDELGAPRLIDSGTECVPPSPPQACLLVLTCCAAPSSSP